MKRFFGFLIKLAIVATMAVGTIPVSAAECGCNCTCECCRQCHVCNETHSISDQPPEERIRKIREAGIKEVNRICEEYKFNYDFAEFAGDKMALANALENSANGSVFETKTDTWWSEEGFYVVEQTFYKHRWTLKLQYKWVDGHFVDQVQPLWIYYNHELQDPGTAWHGWSYGSVTPLYQIMDMINKSGN